MTRGRPRVRPAAGNAPGWGVLLLGAILAPHARAQAPAIDTVVVITHDVFDESEAGRSFVFALANALRFKTRPEIVRRELLLRAGQPYDSGLVAETARNLRRLGLFRSVRVDTARMGSGRLTMTVETRDGWTTQLQANARSTGGEFTWSAGVEERDFLGLAIAVGARYRDDPDRTALTLMTGWSRIASSRLAASGSFDDRSDGKLGEWTFGVPFRALADRTSLQWEGEAGRVRVLQFRDGSLFQTRQRRALRQRISGAFASRTHGAGYLRAGLLAQVKREAYVLPSDTLSLVPDSVTGVFAVQLDWRAARFKVVTHYNGFDREEDVDLSTRVRLATWVAPGALGYARGGVGPEIEAQAGASMGRAFARLEMKANGLITADGLDSGRIWSGLTLASQWLPRQATVLRLEAGARHGLQPGEEIDLGHGSGPRAFRSHAFTGDRAIWGTLEHRWFAVDEVLRVVGIGFAGFLDIGGAWYADEPRRIGGDLGLGLRLGATRATGSNVGRFDLGYRFGDGWTGGRWVLSLGRSYSF